MTNKRHAGGTPVGGQFAPMEHSETEVDLDAEPLECLNDHGDGECVGPVEMRWPGHGEKQYPRCEYHDRQRLEKEEEHRRNYPDSPIPPAWFDPANAGEHWDYDY